MKITSHLHFWSWVKLVNAEEEAEGVEDQQASKYLGQSNGGVVRDGRCGSRSRPGLWEGHAKVECGRAGCLPEAVISQESLFFLKQSGNCMPPGGDYTSLFQHNPGYLNNWVWKYVTMPCHKAEISAFLWGCIVSTKFNRYNERLGFSTLHYWTNNYPAITVKPVR